MNVEIAYAIAPAATGFAATFEMCVSILSCSPEAALALIGINCEYLFIVSKFKKTILM